MGAFSIFAFQITPVYNIRQLTHFPVNRRRPVHASTERHRCFHLYLRPWSIHANLAIHFILNVAPLSYPSKYPCALNKQNLQTWRYHIIIRKRYLCGKVLGVTFVIKNNILLCHILLFQLTINLFLVNDQFIRKLCYVILHIFVTRRHGQVDIRTKWP